MTGVEQGSAALKDGRNTIHAEPDPIDPVTGSRAPSRAHIWKERNPSGDFEIVECDVQLAQRQIDWITRDIPSSLDVPIHEFGHCLGLRHTVLHDWYAQNEHGSVYERDSAAYSAYGRTPIMSYGWFSGGLAEDDAVAASLLRPARDWAPTTGSISGQVTLRGEPARYVYLMALKLSDGEIKGGVGAFSSEEGRFVIEGLSPGDYLIRASPIILPNACQWLVVGGAAAQQDLRDLLSLDPVTVSPGAVASAGMIDLQPGRHASSRLDR